MPRRLLYFSPRSRADLKGLPRDAQRDILADLQVLAEADSLPPPPKVKKLTGVGGYYRLRTADYRSIFRLESGDIYVLRIVPRKELERLLSRLWG